MKKVWLSLKNNKNMIIYFLMIINDIKNKILINLILTTPSNKLFRGFDIFKLKYAIMYKILVICKCSIINSYHAGVCDRAESANGCGPDD